MARAISLSGLNHIVLKAQRPILRLSHIQVKRLLIETQCRFGIQLRALAIMEDHIHLMAAVSSRKQFADALRFFSGRLALWLGKSKLWRKRAWSRPVRPGAEESATTRYVWNNPFKAEIFDAAIDSLWIIGGKLFGELRGVSLENSPFAFAPEQLTLQIEPANSI